MWKQFIASCCGAAAFLVMPLLGCSEHVKHAQRWPDKTLMIQVCLRNAPEGDATRVGVWNIDDTSASTGLIELIGHTSNAQLVYQSNVFGFAEDLRHIAFMVVRQNAGRIYYMVSFPQGYRTEKTGWSAWNEFEYSTTEAPAIRLANHRTIKQDGIEQDAPRIRYKFIALKNDGEWIENVRENGLTSGLSPC